LPCGDPSLSLGLCFLLTDDIAHLGFDKDPDTFLAVDRTRTRFAEQPSNNKFLIFVICRIDGIYRYRSKHTGAIHLGLLADLFSKHSE
jgi:hypothetical protein